MSPRHRPAEPSMSHTVVRRASIPQPQLHGEKKKLLFYLIPSSWWLYFRLIRVQRHAIELQLASFSNMDEQTALRARAINLNRQAYSPDEIRLIHFERNAYFYQKLGETDNLADTETALAELRKKLSK